MLNVQNQQITESGTSVSSFLNTEQSIKYLNSLGDWVGNESWLANALEELNKRYRELRKDIREYSNSWSYSQYCERLAYHYFNLACYYNDELFNTSKIDLGSTQKYLEKCLEKLAEISQDDYSNEMKELENDAEKFLKNVKAIYEKQKIFLIQYKDSNIKKYIKLCIMLGHINNIPLEQCTGEKNRQQIQNIQLFRVIYLLEDSISVPEHKNSFVTAEQSDYLNQAYQLAGQSALGMRYKRSSDNLKKIINATEKHKDQRQEIKDIISKEIAEYKSDLAQVKSYIEENFHQTLSTIDAAYIENKYIKCCASFWLQETINFLKQLTESKSRTVIQKIFNSLGNINDLNQIPNPLNQHEYYILLMEHYKLIRKEDEKIFIRQFKGECLEQIVAYSNSAEKELEFLEAFVNFLSFSKSLQSIIAELELQDFCHDDLTLDDLINNIMKLQVDIYGENLIVLQEATERLKGVKDLFLITKFKEVIGAYTKRVEIQERRIDGRLVVEVTGNHIVVSDILGRLEKTLSKNQNIEEIRFVGADIIHIDANLKSEIFHGKNIFILTKAIKVYDHVSWDVSGKDNDHTYSDNAGTGKDGHGIQGADGYPGESGGNVLFVLVEKKYNTENFTITSNGGKGSKGQNGGTGKDGDDGKGITKEDFDTKFPPAANRIGKTSTSNVKKVVENINASLSKEERWFNGDNNTIIIDNIFIERTTSQGNEITFSYEFGGVSSYRQAFFLYKGSEGQPGGHGGEYGLGGQGGYSGEITVRNLENSSQECDIMKITEQGKDGEKGKGGLNGNHGKNGWDMGYMDYCYVVVSGWTKFFGIDQSSKCVLEYYENSSSDRVWCSHKQRYAQIIATKIEHKKQKQYEERKNTRQSSERKHHAQAVRKKTISQNSVLASYSHHLSSMEKNSLQNLRSDLESTKQRALQAITENEEQQEKLTTELGIKRQSSYQNTNQHHKDIYITTSSSTSREPIDVESFFNKLKKEPFLLNDWFQPIELNFSHLKQLFPIFEAQKMRYSKTEGLKNNTEISKLKDLEKHLLDRYALATLQEITKQTPTFQKVTDNVEFLPESAAKFLVELKEIDSNISHAVLGTLKQYFYENGEEQREKISKFCKEELQNTEDKALKYSIRAFVLEKGHTDDKKYYNEYKEFLEKQERSLNTFYEVFKSELSQPIHEEIYDLWIKSIEDESLISMLEEEIQKHNFLKVLYDRYNNQLKLEYDWDKCCKDQAILKEFNENIQQKRPLSESCRELLAYVFDINIRLYFEDEAGRLVLEGDHNTSSKQIIHMLCRDNKFIQFNIDKNYLKLEEERKNKDILYAQIFADVMSFKKKQQFDDYLENKTFLSYNNLSEDEQYFTEKKDIEKIIEFFPDGDKQELKKRLYKITSQYIGRQGILPCILTHFSSEGRHISSQELCCLINSIQRSITEDKMELNIFCWIVAAYPQKSWIDELILVQLENYFKKTLIEKPEWRKYLSKIENKDTLLLLSIKLDQHKSSEPISTQCIEDTLSLLSRIPNETVSLDGLELSEWQNALNEKISTCKLSSTTNREAIDAESKKKKQIQLQDVDKHFIDKYRLATLQEITKLLPHFQEVTDNVELMPKIAAKFFVEVKEMGTNISHDVLGTLKQYFYENGKEQREKISKFCKEELQNTENKALKYSIKAFVLEKQERSLNTFYEVFKSELSQPMHEEIFDLWIQSNEDKSLIRMLQEKIQKHNFLKALYDRYKNQHKLEYDWDKCYIDQAILKEFNDNILEKGPLSGSYRELLAYGFGINIRLYVEDHGNRLILQSDHNPSSKQIIHMLCRDNKFIQFSIDKNYSKLEEERKKKNTLYAKIIADVMPFKKKQQFDDYLENKTFLSYNDPSEDEQYFNEKEVIEKIIDFFPDGEKQELKERLNKITSQYIGPQGILHSMLTHFSSEGRYVSSQELYGLINSILSSVIEDKMELNIFCWIVAAYPQKRWIDELILLQLENYLKKTLIEKPEWRKYLSKIENKDILLLLSIKLDQHKSSEPISAQCIEDTLRLLSSIPNETVSLEVLELSEWKYALKEKFWTCKLSKLVVWQNDDLQTASYYILSIENIFGTPLAEKIIGALEKKKQELSSDKLTKIFSNFHNEKWNLSEEELNILDSCSFDNWEQKMQEKFTANNEERKITQLVELIRCNANTSDECLSKLPEIKNHIESIDKYAIDGKHVDSFTEDNIKNWVKEFQKLAKTRDVAETRKEMLAVIERAIVLTRKIRLRDTQKLTVLVLLTNDRSTLAQVSTGEGKSLIVVAASIMKALCGEKVDIITSSSVLAKRDAECNKDIYNLFGINVSHNCSEDINKRKEAYSGNQVVYGDLSNFQRDYLLDKFYDKNIFGDRDFNHLIVDEVDSMLLDKGNNMLYLSHDLAGLDKLESVYIYIWQWINRPAKDIEELSYAFDVKAINEAVINDLYGLVKKEDIENIGPELSEQQKNIIWERLIKAEILDYQGKLLKGNIYDNELDKVLSPEFDRYKDRLHYFLKECIEREKFIHVPNNLRPFIERHLESWIKNAITAFCMKAGEDYVVDVDKTGTSPDLNPNIIILDRDTGTDQSNSQWDEALHQFLQLKHGCKLSLQSLKAVFISNVSFFKLYSSLYGLTGTLGSQRERDLLREIHEVDFVTIPTAKSKQFHEEKPILCTGKDEWIKCICNEAEKLIKEKERSVLIICETVNDVETLYKAFGGTNAEHVHTYKRDYEKFDKGFEIVQDNKELGQGQIIIATNLAGRGTDIKITERLRKARGLHVCLTYLPNNIRIEQQAFGRAARSGCQGSGQLIIMDSKGQEYSNAKMLDLRKKRDADELHRVSDIKAYYETQITMEESCFKAFKYQYLVLKKDLNIKKVPTEVKQILLQSCLDKWAFWLDEHNKYVRDLTDERDKGNLRNILNKFISQLKNLDTEYREISLLLDSIISTLPDSINSKISSLTIEHDSTSWLAWVERNPIQMIKLGKYLSQNEKHKNAYENAIELFDTVIKNEPYFSEAAHYYKAFALSKKLGLKDDKVVNEFKQELREAARLLEQHSNFAINSASLMGKIKENINESIIQINAYEKQQENMANLYYMFSRSIDDIFGHTITPQSFVTYDINRELAESLYKDLLDKSILTKPRVEKNIGEEVLKHISSGYGVSVKELRDFLSKYKGKEINEKEFQNTLKKDIKLPDRKTFWKLLIQGKVLSDEVKCVAVNNEKLKGIDPSLLKYLTGKISQNELEKQTLELNNEQIFLNAEWIEQQKTNGDIFKKENFIKIVGKDKYKVLKESGVLSFNRKAHILPSKIESMTFPCYDSITLEDFIKVNITKCEAEKIISELVERKVIEKNDDSRNNSYGLKIKFDEIKQVELSFCPVYENAVKGLLSSCFSYRMALQKIARQLEEKNFPLNLQLITKPHQNLASEFFEQKIIRPVAVKTKDENLETELKIIYSPNMTKASFKLILSRSKLIREECVEELFDFLVEKGWITKTIMTILIRAIYKENIKNPDKCFEHDLYYIVNPDKRQKPLSFSPKGSHNSQNIDETVEKVLDNYLQLAQEDTIKKIVITLKRSRSSLKALEVPDSNLRPLTESCDQGVFANIEELHLFFLNGLDQLLQFEEKKWTGKMLLNTGKLILLGITQIVIGNVIELYSMGIMTHVGAAFVSEGVNDLFYAAGALTSGYYSWEDYRQHKRESLKTTALTVGIGAYFSKSAKVSRFGHKLAGPNFEYGKKIAEMSGKQLIKTAGLKGVGKEVAKRITLKTLEGLAFGLANAGVDILVENYLQTFCDGIGSEILSNIEQEVENHEISRNLKKAYELLGKEDANKLIDDLTSSVLNRPSYLEEFSSMGHKIANTVIQGIGESLKKKGKTGGNLALPISAISKIVVWSERAIHIANIRMLTNNLLDNLDQEMKTKLKKLEKDLEHKQKQDVEKDYESFKKEVIDKWKSLLRNKAGKIITQHIVSPILKEGANHLVRYAGKKVQKAYLSYKESGNYEQLKKLKHDYKQDLQDVQQCDNRSEIETRITEKYHKALLELMRKTRNPDLFANIVQEHIPMDMTCVSACSQVICKIIQEQGVAISGLTIIVEGDNGIRQEFPSKPEGAEDIIIPLKLDDNHFMLSENTTSENNKSSDSKNNCLIEAVFEALPGLKDRITPEEIRAKIANCVKTDNAIRYHIQQGWHALPISLDAYGGFKKTAVVRNKTPVEVHEHLTNRFDELFEFGGVIERVEELTGILKDKVVSDGKSIYKDKSSGLGSEIHASHVLRYGEINSEVKIKSELLYNELANRIGGTDNVERVANVGIAGRNLDNLQGIWMKELNKINFKESLTAEGECIIKRVKEAHIAVLDKQINSGKLDARQISEVKLAKEIAIAKTPEQLFEIAKDGYLGKNKDKYQIPLRKPREQGPKTSKNQKNQLSLRKQREQGPKASKKPKLT